MEIEKKLIQNLPIFPSFVYSLANIISLPFHLNFFIFIIVVLYYNNSITSSQLFLLISSQFLILAIKYMVKRNRPFIEKIILNNEWFKVDYYSFPSGHTFNAFLLFFILSKNKIIENETIIPYLVGLSRVLLGVHYPSDVITGAILAKIIISMY